MTTRATGRGRLPISIVRDPPEPGLQPLTDYFKGFEKVGAVRAVFGDQTEAVLKRLKIMFISNRRMYMGIRDEDGNIAIGTWHLKNADLRILYLDIVHELFHIKQHMKDSRYFHREHMKFMRDRSLYYSSPIEVPAYQHTVREAERIGMEYDETVEYLNMGPVPPEIFATFLEKMELKKDGSSSPSDKKSGRPVKLPVRINRKPVLKLHPFTDYFKGFEKVGAVRALFGDKTERVLQKLKIEFTDSPFRSIFPSDEDGHLVVDSTYVKKGTVSSIYLDVLLALNFIKRFSVQKAPIDFGEQDFGKNPIILESYRAVVEEARQMGLSDAKLIPHLQLPRFLMSPAAYAAFLAELGVSSGSPS